MTAQVKETTEIHGLRSLVRAMRRYDDEVLAAMREINHAAAERVATDARTRAPRLSGALAESVRTRQTAYAGSVVVGGAKVPYANPIVYGWPAHNIEKQPFIYDALDAQREAVKAAYEVAVEALAMRTFPHGVGTP